MSRRSYTDEEIRESIERIKTDRELRKTEFLNKSPEERAAIYYDKLYEDGLNATTYYYDNLKGEQLRDVLERSLKKTQTIEVPWTLIILSIVIAAVLTLVWMFLDDQSFKIGITIGAGCIWGIFAFRFLYSFWNKYWLYHDILNYAKYENITINTN